MDSNSDADPANCYSYISKYTAYLRYFLWCRCAFLCLKRDLN